ncbi:hypothetical protein S83_071074, partial [Arachis hypogaea]
MKLSWPLSTREAIVHYYLFEYYQDNLVVVLLNSVSDSKSITGFNSDANQRMYGLTKWLSQLQRDLWTQYICKACGDRVLRGLHEWEQHKKGHGHRKCISNLKSKAQSLVTRDFLSHKGLGAIVTGCKELTHLKVNGCHNIRALGLESIGRSCQCLIELALLYCQRIVDVGLLEDGEGCKFLQTLQQVDYSNLGDGAICGIPIGCRNLKKLHIHCCYE